MKEHQVIPAFLICGIAAVAALFYLATPRALTNQEIVTQSKYCTDNGFYPKVIMNAWTLSTYKIICDPVSYLKATK